LQRGDQSLAADRWEALIAMSPPDDVRDILAQRVAEWRGEAPPAVAPVAEAAPPVVSIDISLSDAAAAAVSPADTVFIIARDPAQPSPPIAVARRRAADLPATVTLSDSDAMMPARLPSAHDELELVVRVSSSGQPMARSGDWYGSMRVLPAEEASVAVLVDKQEP
jgi:cytochrome c-type biogenesis protein CcmH